MDSHGFLVYNLRLQEAGGSGAIASQLRTDMTAGIPGDAGDLERRREQFGENRFPEPAMHSWFYFFWESLKVSAAQYRMWTLSRLDFRLSEWRYCSAVSRKRTTEATPWWPRLLGLTKLAHRLWCVRVCFCCRTSS